MGMELRVLGSSSSGNCYILDNGNEALIIEAGIRFIDVKKALRSAGVRKGIIALIKLETISRALWGKNYQPKPDASGNSRFYFPWFALWTEREIKETEGLVYIPIIDALNNRAGFGYAYTYNAPSATDACVGSRLWQESREKAKYFGQQFIELWFDYLMFNVKKVQE